MTRVALIGAGMAVAPHLTALHRAGCDVVAVATRDDTRAERVRALFPNAQACWPPSQALERDVDLALVLSPPSSHLEVVSEAARRGVDVLVEKPLDLSVQRAEELVRTAREAGIGLATCYQHRAKPASQALRSLLEQGALGKVSGGLVLAPYWRSQDYYDGPGRGSRARDGGGVLITQGVHILDLTIWLLGVPKRVAAVAGRSPVHDFETEDLVSAVLDYGSGRAVSLYVTTAQFPGAEEILQLSGALGAARLVGGELDVWLAPDDKPQRQIGHSRDRAAIAPGADTDPVTWYQTILSDAIASFANGREPIASGESALRTQRVIAALYDAATSGTWQDVASSSAVTRA